MKIPEARITPLSLFNNEDSNDTNVENLSAFFTLSNDNASNKNTKILRFSLDDITTPTVVLDDANLKKKKTAQLSLRKFNETLEYGRLPLKINKKNRHRFSISLSEDLKEMFEQSSSKNNLLPETSNFASMIFSCNSSRIGSSSASSESSESLNRVVINPTAKNI